MKFFDRFFKSAATSRRVAAPSRDAGALRGSISGWRGPQVISEAQAKAERIRSQRRAADLAANDWQAESILSTICQHAVGNGLLPIANVPFDRLSISEAEAKELNKQFEWLWSRWNATASLQGTMSFSALQALGLRSMLAYGEMLHLPVMLPDNERQAQSRPFSLAIQAVSPTRLRTPSSFEAMPEVKDGIRFDRYGRPLEYYIASPEDDGSALINDMDTSMNWETVPARVAHRKGVFHIFLRKDDEQIRGIPIFANACALFRHLDDAIAFELEAQSIAAQFPVFITRDTTKDVPAGVRMDFSQSEDPTFYTDLDGPRILYGNEGEKPEVLKNERPSANFMSFVRLVQNGIAVSVGLPYLAVAKDYSQVNYSSARAALNEAWTTYLLYRNLIVTEYCQPVYEMLLEEAWLRGMFTLPKGVPSFYEARELWCSADWQGPARQTMDPTKELEADKTALELGIVTKHETMAKYGRDYDDVMAILASEKEKSSQNSEIQSADSQNERKV